jgi:hypothetical protein
MKIVSRLFVGSLLTCAFIAATAAQDQTPTGSAPARILVITREFVRPGKNGTAHEKAESAFVQAMARAKWPTHYLAAQSVSGKPRVLFLTNYDSLEAWEKDEQAQEKNTVLSAALDRANEADGTLLDSSEQVIFRYNADLSLRPLPNLAGTRYLDVWAVRIKPGRDREWDELAKMIRNITEKAVREEHWAVYDGLYGMPNGTYLYLTARKSAAELDRGPMEDKAIEAALGEGGMKKMNELFAACVETSESQILSFSPAMSYPPDSLIKADGDFWKPKQVTLSAEKKAPTQP